MNLTWIIIIIAVVLGVIVGNILLLKHSAKLKMPTNENTKKNSGFDDEDDKW